MLAMPVIRVAMPGMIGEVDKADYQDDMHGRLIPFRH
jgi:hypothetical protein